VSILDQAASIAREAGGGVIPAGEVAALKTDAGGSLEQLMLALIPIAKQSALPALSGFYVGAVAEGSSGALFFGANFEFDGCPVNQTVHAEQATVVNAAGHGETGIKRLAVSAAPCGYCRQFLYELVTAEDLTVILEDSAPTKLTQYLPAAFGPGDLGVRAGMLSRQDHPLRFADEASAYIPGANAALSAARASYAPYTGAFAGAAVVTLDGAVYGAPYLENAAFNPSLSPMQAAIVRAVISGRQPGDFTGICVAQDVSSKINHVEAATWVVESLAPSLPVEEIPLTAF
jgi:cytidine deaminase